MSIQATIAALEAAEKLWPFVPRTRQPAKRRLYLTATALHDLTSPNSGVAMLSGRGFLEASLTRWAAGDLVFGDKKRGRFLVRLKPPPPEIWEIRVTEPVVQSRLLGRFAEPDTLILTGFHTRAKLGKKGSQAWNNAMQECLNIWVQLFGTIQPFSGSNVHQYITEKCDDFPL